MKYSRLCNIEDAIRWRDRPEVARRFGKGVDPTAPDIAEELVAEIHRLRRALKYVMYGPLSGIPGGRGASCYAAMVIEGANPDTGEYPTPARD